MNRVWSGFLNLLFPERCPLCGGVKGFAKSCECEGEFAKLQLEDEPLDFALPTKRYCKEVWACYEYRGLARTAVHNLKFNNDTPIAAGLGVKLAEKYQRCGLEKSYDCVIPVPISSKRLKERGYNQSGLMAEVFTKAVGLPCLEGALVKIRNTIPQMDLSKQERLTNIKAAYEADGKAVKGKRILLVDDVLTTGSTLNECAKTLLEKGAEACGALCVTAVL